jgi:hypothetical protein
VKKGEFPTVSEGAPPEKIAAAMGLPLSAFAPRQEGAIQLILGQDNAHLWPRAVAVSRDPEFSLQFFKSKLSRD